jgi:FkbM family methyltransferase
MNMIKKSIRRIVRRCGFDIIRFNREQIGVDPFVDMQLFLNGHKHPVIFDVGANVGQSVYRFRDAFPASVIHSFEPSPSTYEQLKAHCGTLPGVNTWNCGVGSTDATLVFQENEYSDMSSFLTPSVFSWGKVVKSTSVEVTTLDSFARNHDIDFVHILKSDTQGFDFEVFKGASHLMEEDRIGLIYFEFIFSDMYENLPSFNDVFRYLRELNYSLVTFYESHFQEELVSWTDALFINREFNRRRVEQRHAADGTTAAADAGR